MGNTESSYKHKDRKLPYRSELLELTSEEKAKINEWITLSKQAQTNTNTKNENNNNNSDKKKVKIIFDTDIGTDIDDTLALLMLLNLPADDYELLGITTVYGYTEIRAKVADALINAYYEGLDNKSEERIPVIAGASCPIGTHRDVWHTGTEGIPILTLDEIEKLQKSAPKTDPSKAAKFIVKQIMDNPNEVVLLCLGGLTNIANALKINPKIKNSVKKIVYMGMGHRLKKEHYIEFPFVAEDGPFEYGNVYFFYPNHNISCDTLAAVHVFESGIPISVVNDTVTNKLWFGLKSKKKLFDDDPPELTDPLQNPCVALMESKAPPVSKVAGSLLKCWLDYRTSAFHVTVRGTCPHDALATIEAVYPGKYVTYARGRMMITEWAGYSAFVLDPNGPHEIGVSVEKAAFLEFFTKTLVPSFVPPPVIQNTTATIVNPAVQTEPEAIMDVKTKLEVTSGDEFTDVGDNRQKLW